MTTHHGGLARSGYINGMYPTPRRVAFMRRIDKRDGTVYAEAKQVWDKANGYRLTALATEVLKAGWIEVVPAGERTAAEDSDARTYYRPTSTGRAAIERGRR